MGKRLWLVLCLIVLEGVISYSDWGASLELAKTRQAAVGLHRQSQRALADHLSQPAGAIPDGSAVEAARQLDKQAWSLLENGSETGRSTVALRTLSFSLMLAILA